MRPKTFREFSIRTQLLIVTTLLVVLTTVLLSAISYYRKKSALLQSIDSRLMVSAELAHAIPPDGYFNRVLLTNGVPETEYTRIVDRQNKLCTQLGLQYLWSCMLVDDRILFTTATSPSKDIHRDDHAHFLAVHGDPAAFEDVFAAMQPDFSSFHNEWGHGRMVLLPFQNADGRPYCVGASISIDHIRLLLGTTLRNSFLIGLVILGLGLLLSLAVSASLTNPLIRLAAVADQIRKGHIDREFRIEGSLEVRSLANSLVSMRRALEKNFSALRVEIKQRRAAQRQLQRHRDHLEEAVQHRTAELERSNRELEQFAYVASHDLQEPLRKIIAFGDLLVSRHAEGLTETGEDYTRRMIDAAARMQRLIDDLLLLSRVSTKGAPFEEVDLNEAAETVLSDLDPRIRETGACIEAGRLPTIEADATQMRQLLQNLVLNALKFRKEGVPPLVRISARTPETVPQLSTLGNRGVEDFCELVVQDNGIGFDNQYADRIFGVFQRLHGRGEYPGSGIGLAVCRRIVERHHGTITARGRDGEGAAFVVTLPLKRVISTTPVNTPGRGKPADSSGE